MKLNRIGSFDNPVYVDSAPGVSGVFVVEQPGRIVLVSNGKRSTFLDIRGQVLFGGEQGLLSVAFPADYASSGLFYVYYVTQGGDLAIEEYRRAAPKRADPASARRLVTVNHPGESNHNGGQLQFGPDGILYAGTGDGGGGGDPDNSAQDPNSQLGKILRIDTEPGRHPVGRRSSRSACATRSASRSTRSRRRRRGSSSATSARTTSRRSTTRRSRA